MIATKIMFIFEQIKNINKKRHYKHVYTSETFIALRFRNNCFLYEIGVRTKLFGLKVFRAENLHPSLYGLLNNLRKNKKYSVRMFC